MTGNKSSRILELFFRALHGEELSIKKLSDEYSVSTKSISRSLSELKVFLADHRELVGNAEFEYSNSNRSYRLKTDDFLSNEEIFLVAEILIASRALPKNELRELINKMRLSTTKSDRPKLDKLIKNELGHYSEVGRDCESIVDMLWQLVNCIDSKREITIEYYRSDRKYRVHRIYPACVMFSEFYFYLIAFDIEDSSDLPKYYRIDRIKNIVEHKNNSADGYKDFDEGLLRKRSLFMWPGKLRTIRFEYTGPSVQAILDKLPTAHIIERNANNLIIEAEVYGDGIKMWLLSQGNYIKVISPNEFVCEMKSEIKSMLSKYEE